MKKPVIAVDIDEVLGEYAVEFVKFSNERWGTTLTVDNYTEHWSDMWQISHEETMERAKDIYTPGVGPYNRLNRIIGADEALKELKEKFDIILVTSRPLSTESETRAWLEQHYSGIASDIYFAGIYDSDITNLTFLKTKADVFSQINPVFVIDDQPKHCRAAAELEIDTILFGDYPWNQDVDDSTFITRCHNWQEVLDHIGMRS